MAFHHTACFVFTVMIICNAVLYPSIFSSIFRQWFGSGEKEDGTDTPMYPPHMRHHGGPRNPPGRGPIAGERAAQQMAAQQAQKQDGNASKSRGLMSSILPVYAIGIVGYFAYIMYRIFFKEQDQKDPLTGETVRGAWNRPANAYDDPVEERRREQAESLQRSLQRDLRGDRYRDSRKTPKAPTPPKSEESDIVTLQKRLEDTEKAMQKMMEYMNKMGVAMSQVTEQMAQNENADKSNSVGHKGMMESYINSHEDEVYHDEEDFDDDEYEEQIVVKKVPIRKAPVRRKHVPSRKVVGRRVRPDQNRVMKSRDYPKKRVVYVREVDDNESDDVQDKFDDYVKEERYVDHDVYDDHDFEQLAEDLYQDEENDMDAENEQEDDDDDDDDDDVVADLGSETLLPESDSQSAEFESLRKRKIQANSQENGDA